LKKTGLLFACNPALILKKIWKVQHCYEVVRVSRARYKAEKPDEGKSSYCNLSYPSEKEQQNNFVEVKVKLRHLDHIFRSMGSLVKIKLM
jgi:hypothetical protein